MGMGWDGVGMEARSSEGTAKKEGGIFGHKDGLLLMFYLLEVRGGMGWGWEGRVRMIWDGVKQRRRSKGDRGGREGCRSVIHYASLLLRWGWANGNVLSGPR